MTTTDPRVYEFFRSLQVIPKRSEYIDCFIIEHDIIDYNKCLNYACKFCGIEVINKLISEGINDFSDGLKGAAIKGRIDVINLMISHGASNYEDGLFSSCEGGNVDCAKYFISLGAKNFNEALRGACIGNNLKTFELMLLHGALCNNVTSLDYTINLLITNRINKGGNEDELLRLGVNPNLIIYSNNPQ